MYVMPVAPPLSRLNSSIPYRSIVHLYSTFSLPTGYLNLKKKSHVYFKILNNYCLLCWYLIKTLISFLKIALAISLLMLIWFSKIYIRLSSNVFLPLDGVLTYHGLHQVALLLTPYSMGRFHPMTSFFTESPVIFIICRPKPPFCVEIPQTRHQKTQFSLKTPSFLSRKYL